ncbi:MAG: DNA repair protein RecO [Candidatus Zixiibacteriota bacterium]
MPPPEVTEAICLSVQKFSETSKIAVLYTRDWGRISVVAKGAFRPKSQFWGHLEPLSIAECVIYKKSREQLHLLSSCRAVIPWFPLTASVARAGYGFAVAEFLYRHTYEESEPALYPLARAALESLAHIPEDQLARQFWSFLLAAAGTLGFRPEFAGCDSCGRAPRDDQPVIFDAAAGKIICRDCRPKRPDQAHPHRLSSAALAELRSRQEAPILEASAPPLPAGTLEEIAAAVEDFVRYHLGGGRLNALDFARRMGSY